jgi:ribonuclease P protein component
VPAAWPKHASRMARAFRFSRSKRLTLSAEFKRVREEGSVARGELLSLGALLHLPGEQTRTGFVTSRRIGGAVVRNRVRRRLRAIVRRHQNEIVQGAWIVLIARPPSARATSAALEHEWLRLAKRTSILAP